MPIRILVVDESRPVQQKLVQLLALAADMEIVATCDRFDTAQQTLSRLKPDVIVLGLEQVPEAGLNFLREVMEHQPTPVVACHAEAQKNGRIKLGILAAGAVTAVGTPDGNPQSRLAEELHVHVRNASRMTVPRKVRRQPGQGTALRQVSPDQLGGPKLSADLILPPPNGKPVRTLTERIVAIGVSTGGVQALGDILPALTLNCPPLVIVQHMPEKFTATFAERLDGLCSIRIKHAEPGDRLLRGQALIAPGGKHMLVRRQGNGYQVDVVDGPLISRHRPSVDVLFRSVAVAAGANALGIILTGMGDDGARGLKEMRDMGANTVAQDEQSCVVFGMPKEAIRLGGAEQVLPLSRMAALIEKGRI